MWLTQHPYLACFISALGLSLVFTPVMRQIALWLQIFDHPISSIKTHRAPVPYLGGVAIALSVLCVLVAVRFNSNFPSGTLYALRGILIGGTIILVLGLIDDIKHKGLSYQTKFIVQIGAAICAMLFGVRIDFIHPWWMADILTVFWIVCVMNAVNIIDIMDGLASGVGLIASLGFLLISLPSEQIYVNFLAAALVGALAGFLPYNLSQRMKIFMGDTGSLLLGFLLATEALGTSYTKTNNLAVLAPILILGIPLYDTVLVSFLRLKRGMSPFLGSKDHFALRLEKWGLSRGQILIMVYSVGILLSLAAYQALHLAFAWTILLYLSIVLSAFASALWLSRIKID